MGEQSKIEWTDHTFNPWTGCEKVSPACRNCYAEALARRAPQTFGQWGGDQPRRLTSAANWRLPRRWNRQAQAAGERRRVFCASLADVFEDKPELRRWRRELFRLISETPLLDWLLLTKRADRIEDLIWQALAPEYDDMAEPHILMVERFSDLFPHVWLGATVEDQERARERLTALRETSARVRFLSCEPLLGPLDLTAWLAPVPEIDWIIIGGESGPAARPFHLDHARALIRQCRAAGVAVFVKQLGAVPVLPAADWERLRPQPLLAARHHYRIPAGYVALRLNDPQGGDPAEWPADLRVREFPARTRREVSL
jgi:protein gp37